MSNFKDIIANGTLATAMFLQGGCDPKQSNQYDAHLESIVSRMGVDDAIYREPKSADERADYYLNKYKERLVAALKFLPQKELESYAAKFHVAGENVDHIARKRAAYPSGVLASLGVQTEQLDALSYNLNLHVAHETKGEEDVRKKVIAGLRALDNQVAEIGKSSFHLGQIADVQQEEAPSSMASHALYYAVRAILEKQTRTLGGDLAKDQSPLR